MKENYTIKPYNRGLPPLDEGEYFISKDGSVTVRFPKSKPINIGKIFPFVDWDLDVREDNDAQYFSGSLRLESGSPEKLSSIIEKEVFNMDEAHLNDCKLAVSSVSNCSEDNDVFSTLKVSCRLICRLVHPEVLPTLYPDIHILDDFEKAAIRKARIGFKVVDTTIHRTDGHIFGFRLWKNWLSINATKAASISLEAYKKASEEYPLVQQRIEDCSYIPEHIDPEDTIVEIIHIGLKEFREIKSHQQ
jgi:hypothetical protein